MHHRPHARRLGFALLPLAAAVTLALAGCGGGGGGGGGVPGATGTSFSGAAIDAPVANATITITSGAPLADGGTVIGTVSSDSSGNYTVNVTLPSGSAPIFANAAAPAISSTATPIELASYLGQSDALSAAGALTTSNLPDLDISPVTTAALAVYAATNNNSYSALTPAAYATTLSTYRNDILAIAAAVKAVGDGLCTPASTSITSTTDLATTIADSSSLATSSTNPITLATAAAVLGGNCASVLPALQTAILADSHFAPELDLGDLIEANVQAVVPGTYQLQSVIAETPVLQSINTSSGTSVSTATSSTVNPAAVFVDNSVSIDSSGQVTSTDGQVSGTLVGNLLTLQITDGSNVYALRTKVGSLPTMLSGGQQVYTVQGGGVNGTDQALTMFNADLVPVATGGSAATPQWDAFWNNYPINVNQEDGGNLNCSTGQLPLRFDLSALFPGSSMSDDVIASLGVCIAPTVRSTSSWTMTVPASKPFSDSYENRFFTLSAATLSQTGALSPDTVVWSDDAAMGAPFVMEADGVSLDPTGSSTPLSGNAYYVMGSRSVILSSTSANAGSAILNIQGNFLSQLSEASRNGMSGSSGSSDQQQAQSQGDH